MIPVLLFALAAPAARYHAKPPVTAVGEDQRQPTRPRKVFSLPFNNFQQAAPAGSLVLAATTSTLILSSGLYERDQIIAFDRYSAQERWRMPKEAPPQDARAQRSEVWTLVGASSDKDRTEIAVLRRALRDAKYGGPDYSALHELMGVDARTGSIRWRVPIPYAGLTMIGSAVMVTTSSASVADRKGPANEWRARAIDAFSGTLMRAGAEVRQATRTALGGSSIAVVQTNAYRPVLVKLDTLECVSLPVFPSGFGAGGTGQPLGVSRDLAVAFVNPDDDGAGHSLWPKYIYCVDRTGKKAWQHPRKLVFPGATDDPDWNHYESIDLADVVPRAGVAIASSNRNELAGVRIKDGRILWRTGSARGAVPTRTGSPLSMAVYGNGCFVLFGSPYPSAVASQGNWLGFLDARNGHIRRLTQLPGARRLWIDGDELFVQTLTPTIDAYSCISLLRRRAGKTEALP